MEIASFRGEKTKVTSWPLKEKKNLAERGEGVCQQPLGGCEKESKVQNAEKSMTKLPR